MTKQERVSLDQIISDLKHQTEKYGHFERKGHPGEDQNTERENEYYEVDASTVTNILNALEELRALVAKS